jgi:NADH oxidase (H2O-forming)
MTNNEIIEITPWVTWIGVRDYDIKTFDIVMHTEFGTTYNSYFINSEYKAIIDVAKEKFSSEYLAKLKSVTDIRDIKYIVLNHTEPDHSGSLRLLLDLAPSAIVVGSGNAIRYLEGIVNMPFNSLVVKDGDTLDLGDKTLKFISAPNLHWPDSMYTLLEEEKVLFTCDSFGAHYCSPDLYSDFSGKYYDSFKYYFDIIMRPFSRFMLKAIERIKPLDIEFICPGHGPIHHKNLKEAIELSEKLALEYVKLTSDREHLNILIAYVSAYGYTKEAADYIASGILENGDLTAEVVDIENITTDELEAMLVRADGIILGSPTINQNTLPQVYNLFALINPIRDKGKLGGAFGSYGWSGESTKIIIENFRLLKLKIFEETAQFKFQPGGCKQDILVTWGRKFAKTFIEECGHKKNPGT